MQGGYGGGYGGGAPGGGAPGGGGWGPPPGGAPPGGAPPGGAPPGGYGAPPGGGYGAPPGGGFGGAPPPGGAPPGGFGGAPPPGGGYGAPPPGGGGWAPPPAGGNPGGGFGPYGGGPAGPPQTGANRFFKTAAIGGAIGGVLSAIPFLNALNCCFCLLCMTGSIIGVQMYLKENPQEQLSNGDAATSGAISGVVTGLIAGVLGIVINLITGGANMAMMRSLPPDVARNLGPMMAGGIVMGIVMLFVGTIIYTAFGALGGVLAMSLFFKDRARK